MKNGEWCLPFLGMKMTPAAVNDVYENLLTNGKNCNGTLHVIIDSGGGDIHAAYNLAMLLRYYGTEKLEFIIPRWAKSAATLLACSGDRIHMTHIAELGPLDPQITQVNPFQERLEEFSPLHIELTMQMIRKEFEDGNQKFATGLIERLQFPLTLGSIMKTLEISEEYLTRLLRTRMFKDDSERARTISQTLAKEYADHNFCINFDEAQNIGLKVTLLEEEELATVWRLYRLNEERQKLRDAIKQKQLNKSMKTLPVEILDKFPILLGEESESQKSKGKKEDNDGT